MHTICSNPHLFKVDCKINIDRFAELLKSHPNQAFVVSICCALCEGFWPFVDAQPEVYPDTWDFSDCPPKSDEHKVFMKSQVETEVHLGRYSKAFGPNLLLGMYSSPIHAVPKPGTDALQLINDQLAGEFSPNSMIGSEDVAGTCMDSIKY
jgi:hypothetical protein